MIPPYLFGAICPARGVGAAIIMPAVNAEAMNEHLKEISTQVARGAHAILVVDGAGWHQTGGKLIVPENITLLPLPPYRAAPASFAFRQRRRDRNATSDQIALCRQQRSARLISSLRHELARRRRVGDDRQLRSLTLAPGGRTHRRTTGRRRPH